LASSIFSLSRNCFFWSEVIFVYIQQILYENRFGQDEKNIINIVKCSTKGEKKILNKFFKANVNLLEHFMMEVINQNNPTIY
jgi:hypothetical protein